MSYEITGKVKLVKETQTVGANGFQKREIVIETLEEKYPQVVALEFVKDKVDLLDQFSEGLEVTIAFVEANITAEITHPYRAGRFQRERRVRLSQRPRRQLSQQPRRQQP